MPARIADEAVRIDGLKDLRRALNRMEKGSARELNKALKTDLERTFLPRIAAATPVGKTGRLRSGNRVATRGDKVLIRNKVPYANARHWGRLYWPNKQHPKARPSKVVGVPFIYAAVQENRDKLSRELAESFDRYARNSGFR